MTGLAPWVRWTGGLLVCFGIVGYVYIQRYGVPAWYRAHQRSGVNNAKTEQVTRIKPKFDFYQLLPKIEVPVSDSAPQATRALPVTTPSPAHTNANNKTSSAQTIYVLQVASFKTFSDADTLKAKLSLLGFEVNVHHFKAASGQEWYRVWIGPYASKQQAQQAQAQLSQNKVSSLLRQAR